MKMNTIPAVPSGKNWTGNTGMLKQMFTFFTGYDIMFEASRRDLIQKAQTVPVGLQKETF